VVIFILYTTFVHNNQVGKNSVYRQIKSGVNCQKRLSKNGHQRLGWE